MNQIIMTDARLSQEKVRNLYNSISSVYDFWGAATEGRARKAGIRLAQIRDGESILDVATGTGSMLFEGVSLNPNGFSAGIDISDGMLQKAKSKLANSSASYEIKMGSAFDIPYQNEQFDLILNGYMFDLISHEEMPKILSEFRRVLKPGGRIVLMNMTIGERPGSQIYQWLYSVSPSIMGGCRGVQLVPLLEKTGFKIFAREYIQQSLFPSEVILAKME
ncbi:MAG TPA: methyltransferase domain-containing protein [Leptolinea sp.]